MARRESQGLQITLIGFVMLAVILLVTTVAFWNRSKTLGEQNTKLSQDATEAQQAASKALSEAMQMKTWLGQAEDASIDAIQQQYERDMNTYARSAPEVQRTYKDVPAVLFDALQQRNKQVADLRQQLKDAQSEFEQTRQQLLKERDDARVIQAQTEAELRKTRDDFAQYRDQLNQEKDQQMAEVQRLRDELAALESKSAQQIQQLQRDVKSKDSIISQRDGQLAELTTESFEVPDGRVLEVIPRTGMVYINLGAADGLRRQVTFSVFGVDVNNLAREEKKGSVEVTRIINEHLAEARITHDDLSDPILAGDLVYTPLWNARSALHFALAGSIDIDGDGKDDRELVKQLIRVNNGTIDAEERDGEIKGEITRNTRYLIRGEEPEVGEAGDASAKARQDAWSRMIKQADELGVEPMNVVKLLDLVGYDGEKRTLPLGEQARAEDFPVGSDDPRTQGSVLSDRPPRPRPRGN
jgi:hypothetical protein